MPERHWASHPDIKLLLHKQLLTSMVATPHTHGCSDTWMVPFALYLLLICNAESKLLLPVHVQILVLHVCTMLQAALKYVLRRCRLKCLSLQHELHNELKVLRCEKYVQEAMNATEADVEQQVGG